MTNASQHNGYSHMLYVSVHIPKTAGTSFASSLKHAFSPNEIQFDYQHERDHALLAAQGVEPLGTHQKWLSLNLPQLAWRYRKDLTQLPKSVQLVHGHFPAQKYHRALTWRKPFYITWVREPFARAVSNYFYWQTFDPDTMPDPLVRTVLSENWDLETYLFHPALRNYQSMFLKGLPWQRIDFIGVTETFTRDLATLSQLIKRPLKPFVQNTGPRPKAAHTYDHLRERFLAYHHRDAQLYQYALQRRTSSIKTNT